MVSNLTNIKNKNKNKKHFPSNHRTQKDYDIWR